MVEYLIVSFVAVIFAVIARYENRSVFLKLAFILITVFLSLGYNWGPDVHTYQTFFNIYNSSGVEAFDFSNYYLINEKAEYGYVLINQLCNSIGFWWMRALLFCFENYVIYLLIKRIVSREYYWLAIFIYVADVNFMILSSSMMRQWLAMCIVVLAFLLLEKRKWFIYVVLILLATSIHKSSLMCLPLVFLPKITYNYKQTTLLWLIPAFLVYSIFSSFLVQYVAEWLETEDVYSNYTSSEYSSGVGVVSIVQFLVFIFMFLNVRFVENSKRLYITVLLAFGLILPFYNYTGLASRLGYYFTIFTIGAYPLFLKQVKVERIVKLLFSTLFVAIILYNSFIFWTNPMWLAYYLDYKTLFNVGILKF